MRLYARTPHAGINIPATGARHATTTSCQFFPPVAPDSFANCSSAPTPMKAQHFQTSTTISYCVQGKGAIPTSKTCSSPTKHSQTPQHPTPKETNADKQQPKHSTPPS